MYSTVAHKHQTSSKHYEKLKQLLSQSRRLAENKKLSYSLDHRRNIHFHLFIDRLILQSSNGLRPQALSVTVLEILNIEEYRDLEVYVRTHSR